MLTSERKKIFISLAVIITVGLAFLSLFIVDEKQHKILTFFGRPVRTFSSPGLYLKSPLHTTITLDKRILLFNPTPTEYLTRDKKNVIVDNFVCWSIIDPLNFYVTVNNVPKAEDYLNDLIYSQVSAVLGEYDLSSLISTKSGDMKLDEISHKITENCQKRAEKDYSINIACVNLKQLILPQQNKQSVYDRMKAERGSIAKQYRAEGEEEALKIRSSTDKECKTILSEAYRQAEMIKGEGDAEAIKIYGEAYSQDIDFYTFLRKLQAYAKILNEKTTVVLSSESDLLRLLTEGDDKLKTNTVSLQNQQIDKTAKPANAAKDEKADKTGKPDHLVRK